jgi:hypothetical protein
MVGGSTKSGMLPRKRCPKTPRENHNSREFNSAAREI